MKFYRSNKNNFPRWTERGKTLVYPTLLLILILISISPAFSQNALFGSEGDWLSQHTAAAALYRTAFYETGKILPDWLPIGGGCSSYDFSYYGFLRPDVLISFLLPQVPMSYIISIYAILEFAAGTLLCYFWLKRHVTRPFFSFLGGILYCCASCFYHAHHQIMFVNYMPFLILALWGIETLIQKGRFVLLTISLFGVCLHSYYFTPAVLAVCCVYFLCCLWMEKRLHILPVGNQLETEPIKWFPIICKLASSIVLAIGIAAVLLIPTGLDLLSISKDAGVPASLEKIFSLALDLKGLLYHPYGCGLTILCLYTLLLSIRRRCTRMLSILLLLCLTVNTCSYLLSGLLYVRYKVLIPLIPLLLLLCVQTLEALFTGKEQHSLLLGLLCLSPAIFSEISLGILADICFLIISFILIYLGKQYSSRKKPASTSKVLPLFLLLCVPSVCVSIVLNQHEDYIPVSDKRQTVFCKENLSVYDTANAREDYRFECLTEPFANVNTQPLPDLGRTSMYSSVTNNHYADFYYNTMRNPIRIRNRVALMTDANPFFSYFMGIRYIQTNRSELPLGYMPLEETGDDGIFAENPKVLPTAYTSTNLMAWEEFEKLEFPYTLEALTKYTILPSADSPPNLEGENNSLISKSRFMSDSQIQKISPQELSLSEISDVKKASKKEAQISIEIPSELRSRLLILSADAVSHDGREVTIDINHIRNKRSGDNAPYPNHNDTFTWILSSNDVIETLDISLSAGDYTLSGWRVWSMDTSRWGNSSAQPLLNQNRKSSDNIQGIHGTALINGQAVLDKPGYFASSFPYRQGYKAYVNGTETKISCINQTFVGIPLDAGTYEITLTYCPPGKTVSCWISLVSLLVFVIWIIIFERYKNTREKRKQT